MAAHFAILFFATLLDRIVGDPDLVWRRVPHPIVLIGNLIHFFDKRLNDPTVTAYMRRRNGVFLVLLLTFGGLFLGLGLTSVLALAGPFGSLVEIALVSVFLAQKSLLDHVRAVAQGLKVGGIEKGRLEVAKIVGRDVRSLDEAGVCRAAIESLAENTSDGIVAPFLWYLVFGLPGLLIYKAINTADSMVGHLDDRYRDFGWASAKFDDILNIVPARLTAWMFLRLAFGRTSADRSNAADRVKRDARLHRSPNAGWPESAMAVGLDLALGGPRVYEKLVVDAPVINAIGRHVCGPPEIDRAIRLTRKLFNRLLWATGSLAFLFAILG